MSTLEKLALLGTRRKVHEITLDGYTLNFRGLTHEERIRYRDAVLNPETQDGSDGLLIALAMCEPDGSVIGDEKAVREAFAKLDPMEVVKPLINAILVASGMGKAAEEAIEKK